MKVCDSCFTAAKEESESYGISASLVARTMGSEIMDHICEARDEGRSCGCACNRNQIVETITGARPSLREVMEK
jgi:hypothetical protein